MLAEVGVGVVAGRALHAAQVEAFELDPLPLDVDEPPLPDAVRHVAPQHDLLPDVAEIAVVVTARERRAEAGRRRRGLTLERTEVPEHLDVGARSGVVRLVDHDQADIADLLAALAGDVCTEATMTSGPSRSQVLPPTLALGSMLCSLRQPAANSSRCTARASASRGATRGSAGGSRGARITVLPAGRQDDGDAPSDAPLRHSSLFTPGGTPRSPAGGPNSGRQAYRRQRLDAARSDSAYLAHDVGLRHCRTITEKARGRQSRATGRQAGRPTRRW